MGFRFTQRERPVADAKLELRGHIDVPPERQSEIRAALEEHIRLTREEPGCLCFEVSPDKSRSGRYIVHEIFRSRADFEAHQTRTKASAWGRASAGIARHYSIRELPA